MSFEKRNTFNEVLKMFRIAQCKTALEALVKYGVVKSEWQEIRKVCVKPE